MSCAHLFDLISQNDPRWLAIVRMTTSARIGIAQETTKISRYASLCVIVHTASKVMTAPLCGSESSPPVAMVVTRCKRSGWMPAAVPSSRYVLPIVCNAMLMPPDAEPVIPARILTEMARDMRGLPGPRLRTPSRRRESSSGSAIAKSLHFVAQRAVISTCTV